MKKEILIELKRLIREIQPELVANANKAADLVKDATPENASELQADMSNLIAQTKFLSGKQFGLLEAARLIDSMVQNDAAAKP